MKEHCSILVISMRFRGDGEISGTAVEMPAEVKIRVSLKNESLIWPMIENEDEVMFMSTTRNGVSLENAIRTAFLELALWIEKKFNLNRFDALMLCSQIGKIRIRNLWTVAAKIEKKYLEALKFVEFSKLLADFSVSVI